MGKVRITIMYTLLILGISFQCYGQQNDIEKSVGSKPEFKDRILLGGNFGIQFGTVTLIDLSPQVGYLITDRLMAGVGATYQYYNDNYYHYSTHIVGGRVLLRCYVIYNFFAHAEYELLNYEPYYSSPLETSRVNVNSYLLGGGYTLEIGQSAFMSLLVLWNLNETEYTLYQNPIIRVGFGVGL